MLVFGTLETREITISRPRTAHFFESDRLPPLLPARGVRACKCSKETIRLSSQEWHLRSRWDIFLRRE
jgi:hypothetical protein